MISWWSERCLHRFCARHTHMYTCIILRMYTCMYIHVSLTLRVSTRESSQGTARYKAIGKQPHPLWQLHNQARNTQLHISSADDTCMSKSTKIPQTSSHGLRSAIGCTNHACRHYICMYTDIHIYIYYASRELWTPCATWKPNLPQLPAWHTCTSTYAWWSAQTSYKSDLRPWTPIFFGPRRPGGLTLATAWPTPLSLSLARWWALAWFWARRVLAIYTQIWRN